MRAQALQFYMHDEPAAIRFELAGDLNDDGARRVEQACLTACSVIDARALIVDITFVTSATQHGRGLLARWHDSGVRLIANSCTSRSLAQSVLGSPLPEPAKSSAAVSRRTWLPIHATLPVRSFISLLIAVAFFPMHVNAATLKPQTIADWDEYLQTVSGALEEQCRPGATFLWVDQSPDRLAKVHDGEIVVAPARDHVPIKVQGGLIHHWVGAAFLPNAKVEDFLDVIHDYDRYKVFYAPSVIESKELARNGSDDKFNMQLVNHEFFAKMALDADYQVTSFHLDQGRFYSVARTTRVQQLQNYGQPSEHMLPEGQGAGYIWELFSVARLEQRDGGVYLEMETVALSRGIPAAFRIIADPIVRRVSRSAMLTAIKQTEDAVLCNTSSVAKPPTCPANRTASGGAVKRVE
jgi:hypothetical protein